MADKNMTITIHFEKAAQKAIETFSARLEALAKELAAAHKAFNKAMKAVKQTKST